MAYFQETDYTLLRNLLSHLDTRTVVDVGAEKGSFVDTCLAAAAEHVFAFEPYPPHVEYLRRRFEGVSTVTVSDLAIGAHDGDATLRIAHDAAGHRLDYHHSLVAFADTDEVRWSTAMPVTCRTLGFLAREGVIPGAVGLLKIDTEGGDMAVLQGLGDLRSDVTVAEYCWSPQQAAGHSPYRMGDLVELLEPRGFHDVFFVKRHDELEVIEPATSARAGDWGNLVFVHERVRDRLLPVIHQAMAIAHDRVIDRALWFRNECEKRATVITDLSTLVGATQTVERPWIAAAPPGERERLLSPHPKVSVITPSFNQARFLEQTIRSVLDQDYPNLEYVVIDGGSNDGSVDILRRYADRLAYWVSEPDRGQTDALNKGFARATGDIVCWVNSDDFYYPGALAAAVAAFRANPDLGLVYGRGNRVDEDGEVIREFECTRPFDLDALVYGIDYILQPTTFFRRQALHDVGPFDPGLHYAFDWELWMRFGERFPAQMIDQLVAAGREYASAKTFAGGFPRAEEIRQIVARHTGQELTVGSLSYLLQTLHEGLQRTALGDSGRVEHQISQVLSVCQHLIANDVVGPDPSTKSARLETPAYADGWVGPDLRLRRMLPNVESYLCLRGDHSARVAAISGPLILRATLNDRPLGVGVVVRPGPFTVAWRMPFETATGNDSSDRALDEIVISAPSLPAAQLGAPTDPRLLSYVFQDLTFPAAPPLGAYVASGHPEGAPYEVVRAYRHASTVAPGADGWAGPELRQLLPVPEGTRLLCLIGMHHERVASVRGPLTLWASIHGRPLGAGIVPEAGPFTLCWRVPAELVASRGTGVLGDVECEVAIASDISVVPSQTWAAEDSRALAFLFEDLRFCHDAPAHALMAT